MADTNKTEPSTQTPTKITPHSMIARSIHWGFVALIAYALLKQVDSLGQLADPALLWFEISFVLLFLVLLGARFVFMRLTRPTALGEETPKLIRTMARLGHLGIYASLTMVAVSGLLIGGFYLLLGPESWAVSFAVGLHEMCVMASYFIVGGHVLAAVIHRIVGDGVWSSMVPVLREK